MRICSVAVMLLSTFGCIQPSTRGDASSRPPAADRSPTSCDSDNGGITLPDQFCAFVVADQIGRARHLTVRENGDVYVALSDTKDGGGIAALRDEDGDGRADVVSYFGDLSGTGIHVRGDFLYFAPNDRILRYPLGRKGLLPVGPAQTVVEGFLTKRGHATKPFEFDEAGNLYVNVGAPSNTCESGRDSSGRVVAMDPCPLLEHHAGVWRFKADVLEQNFDEDGYRFATGIRNGVANAWNPFTGKFYVAQHGRDRLSGSWPELYSDSLNAELPAEELFEVDDGDNFGWPYCYYDHLQGKKVLGPEYGGDGTIVGRCSEFEDPIAAFPGHWAPNDLIFYDGEQFPERYRQGAFIAFHGSWNRAPLPQQGYKVIFLPFSESRPSGDFEVFADGFAGDGPIGSTRDARYRPMGLAVGPDGSLYISDSEEGRIWRVVYRPH